MSALVIFIDRLAKSLAYSSGEGGPWSPPTLAAARGGAGGGGGKQGTDTRPLSYEGRKNSFE